MVTILNNLWKQRVHTPYFKVFLVDTPYTVRSHGLKAEWFTYATYFDNPSFDANHIRWVSTTNKIKWYSSSGYPFEVSPEFINSEQFGVRYTGYFNPNTSQATFYFLGYGYLRAKIGQTDTGTLEIGDNITSYGTLTVTGLSSATYIDITYWSKGKRSDSENALVVTFKDSSLPKPIVLSAGYTQTPEDYINGVSEYSLNHVYDVELLKEAGKPAEFRFSVPLAGTLDNIGYKFFPTQNKLQDINSSSFIKPGRMIIYHSGYVRDDGSIATVTRFVGQVRNLDFVRNAANANEVRITCRDWGSFLLDSLNLGYPDPSDYMAAHYIDIHNPSGPASGSKPRTYDAWQLEDVLLNILINADIDPSLFFKKRKLVDLNDNLIENEYLVSELNYSDKISLDRQFNYGNPFAINNVDDEYLWQFSVGDSLYDNVQKIADNYGLHFEFNNEGYFQLDSIKNPVKIKSINQVTVANGTTGTITSPNSLYAQYIQTANASVFATFSGTTAQLVLPRGPNFGTVNIRVYNASAGINASLNVHLYYPKQWEFFNGLEDSIGYNPVFVNIGKTTKYGTYTIALYPKSGIVAYNALLVYGRAYDSVVASLYTNKNAFIVNSYEVSHSLDNLRNDITVIGKLQGVTTRLIGSEEDKRKVVNPNNPIEEHIISRSIDRASVGSISSVNYIGRKLQTIIIEPKISTQERANWLSIETLKRYNNPRKNINPIIRTLGNPNLNIFDKVKLYDIKYQVLSTLQNFWITGISEKHNSDGFITELNLESFEPWTSFFRYPVPDKTLFPLPFTNVKYKNIGIPLDPGETDLWFANYSSNPTVIQCLLSGTGTINGAIPDYGYIRIGREIIKYTSTEIFLNGKGIKFSGITRQMYDTPLEDWATLVQQEISQRRVNAEISPYITEEKGITPNVQFSLLYPGFVKISVIDPSQNIIDVLTGDRTPDYDKGWEFLSPGNYYFSWGMLDRNGIYNKLNFGRYEFDGQSQDVPGAVDLGEFENYQGPYNEKYTLDGPGYYVHNKGKFLPKSGKFKFKLEYLDPNSQYFTTKQTLVSDKYVNTIIYNDRNKIIESPRIHINHTSVYSPDTVSTIDNSISYPTLWWNETHQKYLAPYKNQRLVGSALYRRRYSGSENNGKGLKVLIKNILQKLK